MGLNEKTATYADFSDEELLRALCLLARPEWLRERAVLLAALAALDFNAEDVAEVLKSGAPLNDGPVLIL